MENPKNSTLLRKILKFKLENGWIKSRAELSHEENGFKLFGFGSYGDQMRPRHISQYLAEMFLSRQGISYDLKKDFLMDDLTHDFMGFEIQSDLSRFSLYVRVPSLIIPEKVIVRDWKNYADVPYQGDIANFLIKKDQVRHLMDKYRGRISLHH